MWRKPGFVWESRNADVIKTIPFSSHSRSEVRWPPPKKKCRHDQGKEANDHWERLYSPGCPGTSFTASAFQVLGLLVLYLHMWQTHTLYQKKMLGMLDVIFFPHYTASIHLQDHLGGDLLKMRCVHHTGVILCDYDQSSQPCWSYLEHQKRLGSYSREKFTLAEDVSRPLPSSITGPATSSLISVSHTPTHQIPTPPWQKIKNLSGILGDADFSTGEKGT